MTNQKKSPKHTKNFGINNTKCDIIIPVYKAPEWVKLCVYALFTNTDSELINKVFLINDCNDPFTINCLNNLKHKYGEKIVIEQNNENLGFIKTVNHGLKISDANYVLLLNSDCLLSKNTIKKLIEHLQKDTKIGLICPLASNAANITIPIPEGWNYTQIDSLLEKHFLGKNFDACTVVGNCLMISRQCIKKVGYLDEVYGTGYGEETDYQFKAMEKGFKAKIAIDTYVFHKAEASFGTSKEKQAKLQKNRDLFFSRWGDKYKAELKKYNQNNPIQYVYSHLPKDAWKPHIKTLFYIDGIIQNAGGVHTVVDIVNYLTINNQDINILYNLKYPYQENMLFNPIPSSKVKDVHAKQIVSTVWKTAFEAYSIANNKDTQLLSFVQGYESYFENGTKYGAVELSYELTDSIFTVSKYLQDELKSVFHKDSHVIPNGINLDLIRYNKNHKTNIPTITIIIRDSIMKGDWILMDIVKKLGSLDYPLNINLVAINNKIILPSILNKNSHINLLIGPQDRNTIYQLLQHSNFYIDASLSEGFGLTALEAMAASCIPIVSNSMGINEYIKNDSNGIIIEKTNNSDAYIKEVVKLLNDNEMCKTLIKNGLNTSKEYDFDKTVNQYIEYFNHPQVTKSIKHFSPKEEKIIKSMQQDHNKHSRNISLFNIVKKITPKPLKIVTVKVVNKLYNYINR